MRQKTTLVFTLVVLLAVTLGCGFLSSEPSSTPASNAPNANKSLTDRAVDTAVGESKLGVPECDELLDRLTAFANNPDDNFVVKAGKSMVANKIRDQIKVSLEENQTDKVQLAKDCKTFRAELDRATAQQGQGSSNSNK